VKYNYYGFKGDYVWHLATQSHPRDLRWFQPRLIESSEVVWCQGPRGGVQVVYVSDWQGPRQYGYISQNSKAMQEFMWIKLKAQSLNTKLWN